MVCMQDMSTDFQTVQSQATCLWSDASIQWMSDVVIRILDRALTWTTNSANLLVSVAFCSMNEGSCDQS